MNAIAEEGRRKGEGEREEREGDLERAVDHERVL